MNSIVQLSAALLLDLSSAFDVIDNEILLRKLKIYKFCDETIQWFKSYLEYRRFFVQVESKLSDPEDTGDIGVPQGGILGPLIFIIFGNDLPDCNDEGECVLYADDNTGHVHAKDHNELITKIQKQADESTAWVKDNRMVCSGEKTKLLIIGTAEQKRKLIESNIEINLNVCEENVQVTHSEKLLGLIVNGDLNWKDYIYGESWRPKPSDNFKGLIPKLSQRLGLLKQLKNKMNSKAFSLMASGLFTSLVRYCIHVFGNVWYNQEDHSRRFKSFTKMDCYRLQVMQNKVLRMKLNYPPKNTSCIELIKESGDLSIHQLTAYHTILQVHKTTQTNKPDYLAKKLVLRKPDGVNIFPIMLTGT